jgi:very-short-patch-repair endonuclease
MDPVDALHRLGGVATYTTLERLCGRGAIDSRLAAEVIRRDSRGRYSLPAVDDARRVAGAVTGVVSHTSAALLLGWEVKTVPTFPHVTVPRNRNLPSERRRLIYPHWASLHPDEVVDHATGRERTLIDCLRHLAFDEALAIADSALRHHDISSASLDHLAGTITGPGASRARRVAAHADGSAANPFESVLRAIAIDVRGLNVRPQVRIEYPGFAARPDLVDEDLVVVLEADSNKFHNASRQQLQRDCRRYTGLVTRGWLVVRFAWEDVMFRPEYVREELERLAAVAEERAQLRKRSVSSSPR